MKMMNNNLNGLLIVNKELGVTSRDVVNKVCKILGTKKIGHTGTLDPIATGVLVLVLGKCTKMCDMLTSEYKEYIAEFKLGVETDTFDITGNIVKTSNKSVGKEEICDVIKSFIGKYNQEVPIYSAVKVEGRKLYEYARNNENVILPSRLVNIKKIEIIFIDDVIKIKCLVSKGTYIRSLIRDIGVKLGTYATMTNLTRTKQGIFDIEESYKLSDIESGNYKIIGLEEIFENYYKVRVDVELYKKVSNGVILDDIYNQDYVVFIYEDIIISLYKKEKSKIKPYIMF